MKSIFTLLLSSLFSLPLLAYDGTRLTVTSASNMNLRVEIDGRRYYMDNNRRNDVDNNRRNDDNNRRNDMDNKISIRDLSAGYHTVKIYRDSRRGNGIFNSRQELVYSGSINLRRNYHLRITVNRSGKAVIDERRINRNDRFDDDYNDRNDRWDERNRRNDRDDRWNERDRRNDRWDDYSRPTMNSYEFNQMKETLRREWLESSRLNTARQLFNQSYFNSHQVKEILQLFTFENNKLELAKLAYNRTTDKSNYHVVNDVFSHSSSRSELARYIRDYR